MLEEELVARRGFWRRQRQMERELTTKEHLLAQQLLFDIDSVTTKTLERFLEEIDSGTHHLLEAEKREVQRRGGAEQEYATIIPPEVIAVLLQGDPMEHQMEEAHVAAHVKFCDMLRRFFGKLQSEERNYRDRINELEGALNPDAENTVLQRYRQAKTRLQAELHDHLTNKMEALDEAHSALEYARERSELCAIEAKIVLTHAGLLAGDYDCQLSGVYGDVYSQGGGSDSELIPLLKQLIAMLESGGPFCLSPELLNLINMGTGGAGGMTNNITNMKVDGGHMPGGSGSDNSRSGDQRSQGQRSGGQGQGGVQQISHVKSGGDHKTIIHGDTTVFGTKGKDKDDQSALDRARAAFEKQAYEAAKLENDLKRTETDGINDTLEEYEKKKENSTDRAKRELEKMLLKARSEEEKERLMMQHAEDIQKLNEAFEKQKLKQLKNLRKRLMEERRQKKKELHKKHLNEAEMQDLPATAVPNIHMPSYEELKQELLRLQQLQEQMWADMRKGGLEAADNMPAVDIDPEFERQIRAMDLTKSQKEELLNSTKTRNQDLHKQIEDMKKKLRERKNRKAGMKLLDEEDLEGVSEEEKRLLLEARGTEEDADRLMEDEAILDSLVAMEKEQQRRNEEKAMQDMLKNVNAEDRDRIMAEFNEHMRQLNSRRDNDREEAHDKMKAKLAAKKRMREELDKERAVNKELDHITKTHAAQGDQETANVMMQINNKVNNDKLTPEQQKIVDQQLREQEEMERRQKEEMRKEKQAILDEAAKEEQQIDQQIRQQKQLAMAAHQSKFDRDVALHHKNLNDAEYEKLLAAHRKEMEALGENLDKEKDRQKNALSERIEKRKRLRAEQLAQKHDIEMAKELSRQQQERDKVNDKIARNVENSTLVESVKNKNSEEAENMIYSVLRQRHLKEAIHLEDQLARELEAMRKKACIDIDENRQKQRDALLGTFEQEMRDLIANAGDMSPEELARRKEQLKKQQEKTLKDFDNLTTQLITQAEKETTPQQEVQQMYARLELKEKQLQELADAMKRYSPSEELYKQYQEEARLAMEEAKHYKNSIMKKMQEELERRKAEEKQREEERKRALVENLRKMEQDLEREEELEAQRAREREAEKERLRKQQLEERDRRQKEEIKKSNVSEDEKTRLMREHDENMARLKETMQKDHTRSKETLKSRLDARKQRRLAAERAKLEKQSLMDSNQDQKADLVSRQQEGMLQSSLPKSADKDQFGLASVPTPASTGASGGFTSTGNAEQDWVNMLMMSPLFKQINDLADMLDNSEGGSGSLNRVLGADYSRSYLDVKDAQWESKGDLAPVNINNISPSQFVVYRFGVFIIRMLHQAIGTPEVSLLLASNLPKNNYDRNAFRNSVHFEHARKILFVRRERMDSIGEFVVVILHSLAHIKSGDMTDDSNTLFMREFYKGLRVVCQDMFFSRARNTPTTQNLIGSSSTNSRVALEQALGSVKNQDEKILMIDEIVDMKIDGPTRLDFSDQQMSQRLYGSETLASNARLRQYLASKGGVLASSDFVSSRMSELKGIRSPTPSPRPSPLRRPRNMPPMKSPRDVLDTQLVDMETRNDAMNKDLAEAMKSEADLRQGIKELEQNPSAGDRLSQARDQLVTVLAKKNDLLKRISCLEADIAKKEKELKSKRR